MKKSYLSKLLALAFIVLVCTVVCILPISANENANEVAYLTGDVDGNGVVNTDDAIYLLRHVVYPELYPLNFGV